MSHGEISAHKLPQMMIRVASHEERAYHANSYMRTVWYDQTIALYGMYIWYHANSRAQSFHSLHTSLSLDRGEKEVSNNLGVIVYF